ncbi:hypothetical protein ABBQ38_013324 [Trebouxia sp. C0009 RCD-2024]
MNNRWKRSKEPELSLCQSLYGAYQALSANPGGSCHAFVRVLQAGSGGAGLQRLAARLIPRFAAHFPPELERSAQVLAELVKAHPPDTVRSAAETAALQDALIGLGLATAKLCQLSASHAALQESLGLMFRHVKLSPRSQHLASESASAVAGLCVMFKACSRSCCVECLQLLKQPGTQLHASVCTFLHQQLLAPIPGHRLSEPDLEEDDPDRPCLADEAFVQPEVVDTLRAAVQHISGDVKHAPGWQQVLEQIISQLVPPMAVHKLPSASTLSSPDHASSVDMVISPPPVPPASHHSPHHRTSSGRMQQKQSPARSSGSAGRSPAGSSPRLLPMVGRVQKRTSSALRPRGMNSPGGHQRHSRDSPAFSSGHRSSPRPVSPPARASLPTPWRPNSGPVLPPSPPVKPGLGITAVTRCIWFGGIPAHIGEAGLFKEASLMGDVQFVLFPDCPGRDEALVTFATFGGALLCWERMNGQAVFGGRPLTLRFCPHEPSSPRGHEPPQSAHVYVPDVTTLAGEAAVFRDLDDGHAPRPEHSDIIRSAGAAGLLMRFSRPSMVGVVLQALHLPPRPASPGEGAGVRDMSPPPRGVSSPGRSLGRSPSRLGFDRGPSEGSAPPGRMGQSRLGPPGPGRHERTVWIGQLNSRTTETELLQAFSQFGRIVSHTIRRLTSCAYIDFDEPHAATLARRAMNGALLSGSALRVEFKGQHSNSAPPGREFSPRGRARSGRVLSPRGRSRGSRAPSANPSWEQRPSPSRFGHRSPPRSPQGSSRGQEPSPIRPAGPDSHPNRPAPCAAPLALARSLSSNTAVPQQPTSDTRDKGGVTARVRAREADGATAAAEQPAKRARNSKWDQNDSDAVPAVALPAQERNEQAHPQSMQHQGPSQNLSHKQTQALPTPSLPNPSLPSAPSQHLAPVEDRQASELLHRSVSSSGQPGPQQAQQPTAVSDANCIAVAGGAGCTCQSGCEPCLGPAKAACTSSSGHTQHCVTQ